MSKSNENRLRFRATIAPGLLALAFIVLIPRISAQEKFRVEKDLLGEKNIPADAYYGVQTMRALENFKLSGVLINHYPGYVEAWAIVKLAAARANTDVGAMKPERLAMIEKACQAVRDGKYHDQFLVDWYQGGAGTSTNMNANEVLANIGLELSGHKKGEYQYLEPHDDLNMSQSTNDSYPTAIKVAFLLRNAKLIEELQKLVASFRAKGDAYIRIVKMGRTEMQDAVPMTVGQEFHAFAAALEGEIQLLKDAEKYLYAVNMGATAIGTGLNVAEGLRGKMRAAPGDAHRQTDRPRHRHGRGDLGPAGVRRLFVGAEEPGDQAVEDLERPDPPRLRAPGRARRNQPAGAATGLVDHAGEGQPRRAGGRGIVAFRVMGNDYSVTLAAHSGQLQLNAYEPLAGFASIESQALLYNASILLRTKCVDGITVNEKVLAHYLETTVGIVTALNPVLGYEKATELAGEAYKSGKGITGGHPGKEDPHRGTDQGIARSRQVDRAGYEQVSPKK